MKNYLAKAGKVSGPFSSTEIEWMRLSGEIAAYTWLWDGAWSPVDPAPDFIPDNQQSTIHPAATSVSKVTDVAAVCHDFRNFVSGVLQKVSSTGVELFVDESTAPVRYPKSALLHVNILNEKTQQAVNFEAKFDNLVHIVQNGVRGWCYFLKWTTNNTAPDFLNSFCGVSK